MSIGVFLSEPGRLLDAGVSGRPADSCEGGGEAACWDVSSEQAVTASSSAAAALAGARRSAVVGAVPGVQPGRGSA
ncbi:hypothetical protein [Streptomyces sp. B5E4]|uniref:hypothetical protein n=1 Tax=Streptomyces sp. B5E4 TaxID=3153568 RepID=UPI00325C4A50